jgi:hypothetical protein
MFQQIRPPAAPYGNLLTTTCLDPVSTFSLLRCIDFASIGITNAAMHNIVSILPAVPAMVLLANVRAFKHL